MVAPKPYRNHNKDEFKWKGNTVVQVKRSTDNNITFDEGVWNDEKLWNAKNVWRE